MDKFAHFRSVSFLAAYLSVHTEAMEFFQGKKASQVWQCWMLFNRLKYKKFLFFQSWTNFSQAARNCCQIEMQEGNVEKFLCKMLHIEYGNYCYFVNNFKSSTRKCNFSEI